MTIRKPVRRVVTGHDVNGRSTFLSDSDTPNSWESDVVAGLGASVAWWEAGEAIDHARHNDPAAADAQIPTFPEAGQTIVRIADFPPDSHYPDRAAADTVFLEIDGHAARQAGVEHGDNRHFWFHRTDSLDYAAVLEGEIVLLLDDGETTLRAGDIIVQRATNHAWSNRTDQTARLIFVLIGTEPQSPADLAQRHSTLQASTAGAPGHR